MEQIRQCLPVEWAALVVGLEVKEEQMAQTVKQVFFHHSKLSLNGKAQL
jgi:hypothetical protein